MAENREQNIENEVEVQENCDQFEMNQESFNKATSAPRSSFAGFSRIIHEVSKLKRMKSFDEREIARVCKCDGHCDICTLQWL